MQHIGVVGAGAWGTAIASGVARAGRDVLLWALEPEVAQSITKQHENTLFLKGVPLSKSIKATNKLSEMCKLDALFLVTPSQFLRTTLRQLKADGLKKSVPLIICSKGVEKSSLKLLHEVIEEEVSNPVAVLTGPTFAAEVAQGKPASMTLACKDEKLAEKLKATIHSDTFKVYCVDDIIGAQIGGAVKNVIAIACGIAAGSDLGENARAALMTRGLKEMKRICKAKGGLTKTLMEHCGVGDLILTCSSLQSRNMSLGYALGQGKKLKDVMSNRNTVAEGVANSESVVALAKALGVKVPICNAVYKMVHGEADIKTTITKLIRSS